MKSLETVRDPAALKGFPTDPDDTWQAGFVFLDRWFLDDDGRQVRIAVPSAISTESHDVGCGKPVDAGDAVPRELLSALVDLARNPDVGHLPGVLELRDPDQVEALSPFLLDLGVSVVLEDDLDELDRHAAGVKHDVEVHDVAPPALDGEGVDAAAMRSFAEAAADLYATAPWNHLTSEDLVRIETPVPDRGLKCFSVLGCAGQEFGLGFYAGPRDFDALVAVRDPIAWLSGRTAWQLTFGPVTELPAADARLWSEERLPVAGEHAYPMLARLGGTQRTERPDARTLAYVEGLLRALAATGEDELDSGRWRKVVTTHRGELALVLTLPALLRPPRRARRGPDSYEPRLMERTMLDIRKMIEKQMFENPEELDAFVATHVVGRRVAHPAAITSMERAQDLVYQALESTGRLRVKRAREALKEWPDCAEALVLLAEEMPDAARRLDLYRQAVAAGERAFGPDAFHEHVGHFWAVLETRPYMRARLGLAESEWEAGHHEAAFEHWGEMLRLNPGDNQGVRYILLGRLLDQSRDGEARELLARFREEVSALFAYARALVEFRSLGDQAVSRAALATAIRRNPHVVKYLLGTASLPDELPSSYGWKSDEEAMIVADQFFRAWEATPGALDWLRTTRGELRDADKARRARRSGKR